MDSANYRTLMGRVNPLAVSRYLESIGWRVYPRKNQSIRVLQKEVRGERFQVVIPREKKLFDYKEAMLRAVEEVAAAEVWSMEQTMMYFLNPNTDILRIRVARDEVEPGNILLDDAVQLYENAKKLLGAAAMDVRNPKAYHQGRAELLVKKFLEQCRFGQTEVGSYIVSVICPMADVDQDEQYRPLSLFSGEEELGKSFTRQVTTKIMRNIGWIKRSVDSNQMEDMTSVKKSMISANFYEALYGMVNLQNAELEIQADWFPGVRPPAAVDSHITLSADYGQPLQAVISTMKRKKAKQLRILGRIQKLESSPDLETRKNGTITLVYLDEKSKARRMVISLDKDAYAEAVQAHMDGKYVEVSGEMDSATNQSRMRGDVFTVLE